MFAFERDILEFVKELHGNEGYAIVKFIMAHEPVKDEDIERGVKIRENIIRKVLYDLHNLACVNYKKIKKGEGRDYDFLWTVSYDGFYRAIVSYYNEKIEEAKHSIEFLQSIDLYSCGHKNHPVMTFDEALEYNFMCPICDKILTPVDYSSEVEELRKQIEEYQEKIKKIERHYKRFVKKFKSR